MKKTWDTKNGPKTFPASKDLQLWNPMHPKIGLLSWDFNLLEKRQKKKLENEDAERNGFSHIFVHTKELAFLQ